MYLTYAGLNNFADRVPAAKAKRAALADQARRLFTQQYELFGQVGVAPARAAGLLSLCSLGTHRVYGNFRTVLPHTRMTPHPSRSTRTQTACLGSGRTVSGRTGTITGGLCMP